MYRRAKSGGSGVQGFGIPSLTRVFRVTRGEWLEVSESRVSVTRSKPSVFPLWSLQTPPSGPDFYLLLYIVLCKMWVPFMVGFGGKICHEQERSRWADGNALKGKCSRNLFEDSSISSGMKCWCFSTCFCVFAEHSSICSHSDPNERASHPDREPSQRADERSAAHENGASGGGFALAPPAASLAAAACEGEHQSHGTPVKSNAGPKCFLLEDILPVLLGGLSILATSGSFCNFFYTGTKRSTCIECLLYARHGWMASHACSPLIITSALTLPWCGIANKENSNH